VTRAWRFRRWAVAGFGAAAWFAAATVQAQPWVPGAGHGAVSVTYVQSVSTQLTSADGSREDFGSVIDRRLQLRFDYGLGERWALTASLPYQRNRYTGDDPHDPSQFPFPPGQSYIDDGRYHGGWSDASLALRFQWLRGRVLVTPFVAYATPVRDYTFFAHSAPGDQQWAWQVGVHAGQWLPPPWQTVYWRLGYAYAIKQKLDHRRVDRGLLSAGLGWQATPRFDLHFAIEHGNSLADTIALPRDFTRADGSPIVGNIIYHDQLAAARYTKAYLGAGFALGEHYELSVEWGRSLAAANTHIWRYEASIGISRSF
jgi:hypothetical protein